MTAFEGQRGPGRRRRPRQRWDYVPAARPGARVIDHVLVPMDHSPLARRALEYALEVHPDASLTVIHVVNFVDDSYSAEMLVGPEELRERAEERTEQLFEEARALAAEADASLSTVTTFGDPARNIVDYAEDEDVDLVVIGSHGRSLLSRILLGDTADRVVQRAPVPVTVVR